MKELLQQKALEYARNHSSAPDKETPDWIITDYLAGANAMREYAEQQAMKEAIAAMDWIRKQRPDVFYGSPTSEQLYKLFKEEK